MERVTTIRLKKASGSTAKYFQFHHWYVEIGTGGVYHFDHQLKTDDNFDNLPENEHFDNAAKPYAENDKERFRADVLDQEDFLKKSYGSCKKAYRVYNDPNAE